MHNHPVLTSFSVLGLAAIVWTKLGEASPSLQGLAALITGIIGLVTLYRMFKKKS